MLVKSLADLVSDLVGLAHDRNTGRVNICLAQTLRALPHWIATDIAWVHIG